MPAITLRQAKTRPWPGDIDLNGALLMLAHPPNQPALVRQRALDIIGSVSTEFVYSRASPLKERPHTFSDMTHGLGLDEQQSITDDRYSYTLGADLSCGIWQKGPDITTFTPATTAAFAPQFGFEFGASLYPLAGRYVLVRANDASWTVSKDLGSGKAALQCETFYSNGGGGVQLAFLAVSGDKAYSFDGATWTQFATFTALAWKVVGRDLYRAHDINLLSKCTTDADPTVEANYTAANLFIVGDKSSAIVSMGKTIGEVLLIFKTDGVYTLAADGTAHHLFPQLAFNPGPDNGKVVGYFENDLYVTYGTTLYRITPDLTIQAVGPDRVLSNTSAVHGRITAFCGVSGMFGHAGLYNFTDSYLLKFGGQNEDSAGELHRTDAWHGSLSTAFSSKMLRSLQVSTVGAPSNHTRTYAGFDDGSAAWWTNPCTPNPLGCDQYRWTTSDAYIYFPRWHGFNLEDAKALHSLSIMGPLLNATNWLEFAYKVDPAATTWTDFGTQFNQLREKVAFLANTTAPLAMFRATLRSSANTATPQISSLVIWYAWRPDRVMDVQMQVLANDGLLLRNGVPMRISGNRIKAVCEAAVDAAGSVRLTLPTGETENVSFLDLTESTDWDDDRGDSTTVMQMRGVTFATLAVYGTYDRLSVYTYDDLAQFSEDELQAL